MPRCNIPFWFLILCLAAGIVPWLSGQKAPAIETMPFPGWPTHFEGKPLTPLPLSALEASFQKDFPGRLARFTDGRREVILRWVTQKTRKLHPSSDCFKASGYTVEPIALKIQGSERWSGFTATRGKAKLSVSERIYTDSGQQWSDVSSWYWTALSTENSGPWWAVTIAE